MGGYRYGGKEIIGFQLENDMVVPTAVLPAVLPRGRGNFFKCRRTTAVAVAETMGRNGDEDGGKDSLCGVPAEAVLVF